MAEMKPAPIRQSELHGRLVIDLETTEELGRLSHFLVDVKTHQVEGFICRQGLLGQTQQSVPWVALSSIGQDSVLVQHPEGMLTERFEQAQTLNRQEIWADSGNHVGQLADYCIDLETGAITQYLFTAPGWQGMAEGLYSFSPAAIVSAGKRRLMVRQSALEEAAQFLPGVTDRLAGALQHDFEQTRDDLQRLTGNTQDMADQVQTQTQKLAEQARSQVGQIFGQVKQRSKKLRSRVNDGFADAAANLQAAPGKRLEDTSGTTIDVNSEPVWPEADVGSESPQDPSA